MSTQKGYLLSLEQMTILLTVQSSSDYQILKYLNMRLFLNKPPKAGAACKGEEQSLLSMQDLK